MCGGMSTDARWAPTGAVRHVCHDCGAPCVPSVEHVLWECSHPAYVALRTRTKPHSTLRSRLGWSPNALPFNEEVALITMLGGLRKTEVSLVVIVLPGEGGVVGEKGLVFLLNSPLGKVAEDSGLFWTQPPWQGTSFPSTMCSVAFF